VLCKVPGAWTSQCGHLHDAGWVRVVGQAIWSGAAFGANEVAGMRIMYPSQRCEIDRIIAMGRKRGRKVENEDNRRYLITP